jgi:hypothetical protein
MLNGALIVILAACATTGSPGGTRGPGVTAGAGAIELERRVVTDPQINGIEAYAVLVPAGWRFDGAVEWRHDLANLAAAIMVVEDPATGAALETYYPVPHGYTEPSLIPIGGNWLGSIVAPPVSAADYAAQLVLPTYRPGASIVAVESLPNVAATVRAGEVPLPGGTVDVDAVRVRIGTTRGGVAFDEDFYVAVAYHASSGIVQWGARHLYSIRAPAGTLETATPMLQAIASSVEVSPLWSADYQVVFDLFVQGQYAAIRSAGELSRYLAQNADEIAEIYREGYEAQQAAYDRVFEGFSEYVRGTEPYEIPSVGRTQIPNQYTVCHAPASAGVLLVPAGGACPQGTDRLQPVGAVAPNAEAPRYRPPLTAA